MLLLIALVAVICLHTGTAAQIHSNASTKTTTTTVTLPGICESFGNTFCNVPCKVVPGASDVFFCECPKNTSYFDAAEKGCLPKTSCKTTDCAIGHCKPIDSKTVTCSCDHVSNLTRKCEVEPSFQEDCTRKGGHARVPEKWQQGPICDCGDWAAMDDLAGKCVPTTCLHPGITCSHLCNKGLLGKDLRCCQGWDSKDCSNVPREGSYCSPGTIWDDDEGCMDACSLHEARLLCPHGCRQPSRGRKSYECNCKEGSILSDDGITCEEISQVRSCNETEKQQCRSDQSCSVKGTLVACKCAENEHLVDDVCTSKCVASECHERFMDCSVAHGKQDCSCPWKHRMTDIYGSTCTLRQYYYTVSFKLNTSLESQNCSVYAPRVKAAMRTALGYQVHAVTIANCTDNITARLILNDPLPKPLQKRLQACEHPIGDVCMLYPMLPIVRGSATEIEEENLCDSLLKEQEGAYNGVNECVKAGDIFWFKCKQGYREVDVKTQGRLQRSICEVDPEAPTPAPDPCLTVGAEVCGDVRCEPYSDNSGFTCKCGIDFFFHAMEKRCYNMKSCKVHKCERGLCVDHNGMFPASCQCNDYPDLTLNCKVKETVRAICATQDKVARINPDNSVSCDCPPHTRLIRGYCKPIACLNATLTCKDVCLMKDSHRDTRCCRNWDPDHCERTPHDGSFCPPGYIADLDTKECKHVCNTTHATDICDHGCTQLSEDKADYTCNCGPTQQLANDGISCVERTKCHEEDVIKCESEQKTCFYDSGKAVCRCPDNTLEMNGTCIDSCTSIKQRECSVIFGECKIINHYEACMCIKPLLWHPEEKKCFLEKTHKYVARFRVNDTSSPNAEYGVGECDDKHAMMEQAMQILYGVSLTSIRMLQCSDEYKVELNFASEPPSVLLEKIRTCEHPNENGGCFFPPALNIVKDSVSEVREEDLCETYLTGNLGHLKGLYVCKKRENGRYALQCSEKYKSVSYFSQGMLDINICTEQKCELYCTGPERQCVEGKCVCHVNYFEDAEGVCVPQCSRKPCKNGGTCETGVRTSFYCSCPPYFTGPTCEVPFQAYADAQKKLSAVGVVLSVLIMFCVGAAAVVIRRIKNRNRAYEDL